MKPYSSSFISVRDISYHTRHWGPPDAPILFMLHGWMDVSASFQFVVDHLQKKWHIIAPDWRGFGLTQMPHTDCFWFPDLIADLDIITNHYSPTQSINLIGHSMGGNVASIYAGVRPTRINKLINLEGFGLPNTNPQDAPARYREWLDELHTPPQLKKYATQQDVILRLQKNNPRLTNEKALFLSEHWAAPNTDGMWEIRAHPAHKQLGPLLHNVEESMACWSAITAPILLVEASDTDVWKWIGQQNNAREEIKRRIQFFNNLTRATVDNAGHMLHHDQPKKVAQLIEDFLI